MKIRSRREHLLRLAVAVGLGASLHGCSVGSQASGVDDFLGATQSVSRRHVEVEEEFFGRLRTSDFTGPDATVFSGIEGHFKWAIAELAAVQSDWLDLSVPSEAHNYWKTVADYIDAHLTILRFGLVVAFNGDKDSLGAAFVAWDELQTGPARSNAANQFDELVKSSQR